ncbi:MAG: hypothetical protein ACYDBB_18580 [Armatimonadota bacterium]
MSSLLFRFIIGFFVLSLYCVQVSADAVKPPTPNAFDYYQRAGAEIGKGQTISDVTKLSLQEKRSLLQKYARVFDILQEGYRYPCQMPTVRSLDTKMPYLLQARYLTRLCVAKSDVNMADRKWFAAAASGIDAVYLGKDFSHGTVMIGHLVGIACQSMGRKCAWGALPHLSAEEAKALGVRMQSIIDNTTPYAEVLSEEKCWGLAVMQDFLDHPDHFRRTLEENGGRIDASDATIATLSRPTIQNAMVDFAQQLDAMITMAKTPYPQWKPLPKPSNILTSIFLVDFVKGGFKTLYNDAHNRLFLTSCALEAYKQDRGAYPATLSELCPTYLLSVPSDPFSVNAPLSYRNTATGYLLYSIGPDAHDDNGAAVQNDKTPTARFRVTLDSKGDIVAGINID